MRIWSHREVKWFAQKSHSWWVAERGCEFRQSVSLICVCCAFMTITWDNACVMLFRIYQIYSWKKIILLAIMEINSSTLDEPLQAIQWALSHFINHFLGNWFKYNDSKIRLNFGFDVFHWNIYIYPLWQNTISFK